MHFSEEQGRLNWWAQGDTPVRDDSRVTYLVDGRNAMLTMCRHFLKAQQYIYLADWGLTADMEMVRGEDHDGGQHREQLIQELREAGLQEADIAFWFQQPLSVKAVLGYAVSKGVEVKVLVWKSNPIFSPSHPQQAHDELTAVGVQCILDDSAEGLLHHPIESLHQKIAIVDGTHAFVGGVDLLIEQEGKFDRWDTPAHLFTTPLRQAKGRGTPYPWHDAHSLIEGPAAADVEKNFRQRWNDVIERHRMDSTLLIPERPLPPSVETQSLVQVARTIPEHTYRFEPPIIRGIAQLYANAFKNIQRFVYLENQYLWLRAYFGVDLPLVGTDSPEMETNLRELAEALRRGAAFAIVLPDHPNVGRAFTDAALTLLRDSVPEAVEEGRIQAFCLATCDHYDGCEHYRPIYVHAKVAIVDDIWSTVGSGNLNNRGMADDTEINVATLDGALARGLRLMLQGEHLGLFHADDQFFLTRLLGKQRQTREEQARAQQVLNYVEEALHDPLEAIHLMHERAWENFRRYQANQPLIGHLLPYLTGEEARQQGLNFHEEHGWIEER